MKENKKQEIEMNQVSKESTQEVVENTTAPKDEKPKKNSKKVGLIVGIVIAILLVIYVGFAIFFQSHFVFNSSINGVNSSCATPATMKTKLSEAASGYQMTIIGKNGKTEMLSEAELGMEIDIKGDKLQALLAQQNGFLWGYYLVTGLDLVDENLVSCKAATIETSVSKLACVNEKNPTATKNANVKFENNKFVVVDETYGTEIDVKTLNNEVQMAALSLNKELNLEEQKCYVQPTYTADSKEVKELIRTLNKYADTKLTYEIGSATEQLSKEQIGKWLSGNDKMKPQFDEEAMSEYVASMAKKYDTYGQSRTLQTQYGVAVTVPAGNYGWRIDREKELAQLEKDIQSGGKVNRDFVYLYKAASRDANDYGNSYVEINKTAQHVFLVINGSVVMDTPMVSGKEDGEHGTPPGAFRITYCEKNATLRGPGYVTPVAYWMPFNGDIGLHDATWQKSFGGQRYREGYGSHGCVNLPLSAAGTIFGYVQTGFPVLMYDLPGTETVDTLTRQQADAVINQINAIGGVTLASADAIAAARIGFDALTDSGKGLVTNGQVLLDAEATFANLVTQEQQNQERIAQEAAAKVMEKIDKIGKVTPDSGKAIQSAEEAYAALSDYEKGFVDANHLQTLGDARYLFDNLEK